MRNKKPLSFSLNLTVNLGEIQSVATTSWFIEARTRFILCKKYSREISLLTWFYRLHAY